MTTATPPTTSDELALRAAIAAHPSEDTPRLALADLLDEHSRPDEAYRVRLDTHMDRVRRLPDDDGPRLMLAEWLEGQPQERPCPVPSCGNPAKGWDGFYRCRTCKGAGAIDTGHADRAELLRVQIELAKFAPEKVGWRFLADGSSVDAESRAVNDDNPARERLQRREMELLTKLSPSLPTCPVCPPRPAVEQLFGDGGPPTCAFCGGKRRVAEFSRGLVVATVPSLTSLWERGEAAADDMTPVEGAWRLTPLARLWRDSCPWLVGVEVRDREPYHYRAPSFPPDHVLHGLFRWGRRSSWGDDNTDLVPDVVFDLLQGTTFGESSHSCRYYASSSLARAALASAVARALFSPEFV